jgi:hypothetical protein
VYLAPVSHSLPVNVNGAITVKTSYACVTVPRYITAKRDSAPTVRIWKIAIVNRFSKACVTFSSVSAILEKDVLKYKRNRLHKVAHINKYR